MLMPSFPIRLCAIALLGHALLACRDDSEGSASPSAGLSTASSALLANATRVRTCLPGRFVGKLASPALTCPSAETGWKTHEHRTAMTRRLAPNATGSNDTSTLALGESTCSYSWTGREPAPTQPPAVVGPVAGWLHPLCVDETPPPNELVARGCPEGIQVGLRPQEVDACPPARGWRVSSLFPGKSNELGRFCLYSAATLPDDPNPDGSASGLEVIRSVVGGAERDALPPWVHADCAVVGTLGAVRTRADVEQAYRIASEALDTLPTPLVKSSAGRVRVAVVDSALDFINDGLPGVGRDAHGRAMAALIGRMACPERAPGMAASCPVDVRNHEALWLERRPNGYVRNPRGGFFGLQSDLAVAIVDAVDSADVDQHVIVNLSLGWPKLFGGEEPLPQDFPAQVRAVYDAIEYARCQGAEVIAAAGNALGRPATPVGPLVPGRWEERSAPTASRCRTLGVLTPRLGAGGAEPLLRAAGGVDGQDRILFNTPMLGRPMFAAPAFEALVADTAAPAVQTHAAYTGSSNASALTSAIAAIIWSYLPGLDPAAVMDVAYRSGVPLGQAAHFCFGGKPCGEIHRLSVCRAAQAACRVAGCTSLPTCSTAGALTTPADQPDFAALPAVTCAIATAGGPCVPIPTPSSAVPSGWQLAFARPQPGAPTCTTCGFFSLSNWLSLVTNVSLSGTTFQLATASAIYASGNSFTVDESQNANFLFVGGDTVADSVDLSWGSEDASLGVLDFYASQPDSIEILTSDPLYLWE